MLWKGVDYPDVKFREALFSYAGISYVSIGKIRNVAGGWIEVSKTSGDYSGYL